MATPGPCPSKANRSDNCCPMPITTAFTMPSCRSWLEGLGRALGLALLLALLASLSLWAPRAEADNQIRNAEILATDEGYVVNADIDLSLNPRLEEALRRGVSLYFVLECDIYRPRWYWLDEQVVNQSITYRLSYQAITRAYRLSIGSLHQNFDSVEAASKCLQGKQVFLCLW